MYFDQISELSSVQLGLVGLGIVVLLGGVWAVSVQQGGGIKEGAWVEEDADDEEVERAIAFRDTFSGSEHSLEPILDTSRPMVVSPNPISEVASPLQNPFQDLPPRSPLDAGPLSRSSITESSSRHRDLHIRTGSLDASSPPTSPQRRSQTRPRYGTLLGAEAPAGALVAPGFSIGLSPVSPGFALIPRARRRLGLRSISEGSTAPGTHNDAQGRGHGRNGQEHETAGNRRWRWVRGLAFANSEGENGQGSLPR